MTTKTWWSQSGKSFRDRPGPHMKKPVRIMTVEPQRRDQYSNFST
jgi:hypothetical protein